ncbi:hypothetical protein [Pontibacter qinzhouensis]|uniref:hypothetical protein n=1 Tax=Pontibacter qinzhouensis TaxID=2603253 RepID=UPI001C9C985A|nr:hypothetical protein [Pontibacter qinzhouensis]
MSTIKVKESWLPLHVQKLSKQQRFYHIESDAPVMFDSVEEASNPVSVLVEVLIHETGLLGICSGRNHYFSATFSDESSKGFRCHSFCQPLLLQGLSAASKSSAGL